MLTAAFAPYTNLTGLVNTAILAATAVAQNQTLPLTSGTRVGANQLRIRNAATVGAHINIGAAATLAAATVGASMAIAPGAVEVFTISPNADTVSVILESGTGNVEFTIGEGL
jgi:hypothetical protein